MSQNSEVSGMSCPPHEQDLAVPSPGITSSVVTQTNWLAFQGLSSVPCPLPRPICPLCCNVAGLDRLLPRNFGDAVSHGRRLTSSPSGTFVNMALEANWPKSISLKQHTFILSFRGDQKSEL